MRLSAATLLLALCVEPSTAIAQVVRELPGAIWEIARGDVGPTGETLRPWSSPKTVDGTSTSFLAVQEGSVSGAAFSSGRLVLRQSQPIYPGSSTVIVNPDAVEVVEGGSPWLTVRLVAATGAPGSAVFQGGRAVVYTGMPLTAPGFPTGTTYFVVAPVYGASATRALVKGLARLPSGATSTFVVEVETDGRGTLISERLVLRSGMVIPALQAAVSGIGAATTSPSGRTLFTAAGIDFSLGISEIAVLLDGAPIAYIGDAVAGTDLNWGGIRALGLNDSGSWGAIAVRYPDGEFFVMKNGQLCFRESSPPSELAGFDVRGGTILRMTGDGRLFWMISGYKGVPAGPQQHAIFMDDTLLYTSFTTYQAGKSLLTLASESSGVDYEGLFLSLNGVVEEPDGSTLQKAFVVPLDQSSRYCINSVHSGPVPPHIGVYGSPDAGSDLGWEVLVNHLPSRSPAMVLASLQSSPATPLASALGSLCVGGNILRAAPVRASAIGSVRIDLASLLGSSPTLAVMPGDRWHFQCWYRDRAVGGTSVTRLTDAVSMDFR